jgi:hypothetical protein
MIIDIEIFFVFFFVFFFSENCSISSYHICWARSICLCSSHPYIEVEDSQVRADEATGCALQASLVAERRRKRFLESQNGLHHSVCVRAATVKISSLENGSYLVCRRHRRAVEKPLRSLNFFPG